MKLIYFVIEIKPLEFDNSKKLTATFVTTSLQPYHFRPLLDDCKLKRSLSEICNW